MKTRTHHHHLQASTKWAEASSLLRCLLSVSPGTLCQVGDSKHAHILHIPCNDTAACKAANSVDGDQLKPKKCTAVKLQYTFMHAAKQQSRWMQTTAKMADRALPCNQPGCGAPLWQRLQNRRAQQHAASGCCALLQFDSSELLPAASADRQGAAPCTCCCCPQDGIDKVCGGQSLPPPLALCV